MEQIEKSLTDLHEKVDTLNEKVATMPYRIKMLERITFGAVKLVLVAFVVSLIFLVIPKQGKVSAGTKPIVVVK